MSRLHGVRAIRRVLRLGVVDVFFRPRMAARFWRHVLASAVGFEPSSGSLPRAKLEVLFPAATEARVSLVDYSPTYGQPEIHELICLCQIVRLLRPQRIFEIGTFEGSTTLQLAANSEAKIWTLDLPPGPRPPVIDAALDVFPSEPGWRIHHSSYRTRCEQLLADSSSFDFSPWDGSIDLVFVDGSHHYSDVRKDSANALRIVKDEGIVIWHDYAPYAPGVERAIDELTGSIPIVGIKGTSFAIRPPLDTKRDL